MHSSRMRTSRGSSRPWGAVCLSACLETPPVVGLETPPGQIPQLPPGCGPGDPPCKACWDTIPPRYLQGMLGYHLQCMLGYHTPPPWTEFLTHACENITCTDGKNAEQSEARKCVIPKWVSGRGGSHVPLPDPLLSL